MPCLNLDRLLLLLLSQLQSLTILLQLLLMLLQSHRWTPSNSRLYKRVSACDDSASSTSPK